MNPEEIAEKLKDVFDADEVKVIGCYEMKEEEEQESYTDLPDNLSDLYAVFSRIMEGKQTAKWLIDKYGHENALILSLLCWQVSDFVHEIMENPEKYHKRSKLIDLISKVFD